MCVAQQRRNTRTIERRRHHEELQVFAQRILALETQRETEIGVIWNDPALRISWPVSTPLLSPKDQAYPSLAATEHELPVYSPSTR